MLKRMTVLSALIAVAALIGCNGGGASIYYIQGFNVVPDGPPLSYRQNGLSIATGVVYGNSSGFLPGTITGTKKIEIQPLLADLSLGDAIIEAEVDVSRDRETTLLTTGFYDDPQLIVVTGDRRRRPISQIYFQFANALVNPGAVDVYVAAPDTDLSTTAPFATLDQYEFTESVEIPFAEYVISVTPAGEPGNVLYQSPAITFVDFPESDLDGVEWLLAIGDNVGLGDSAIRLLVSTENGSFPLDPAGTGSALRITNASPGAPAVDSFVDDDFSTPLTTNTAYAERSPRVEVDDGVVKVAFTETGTIEPVLEEYERELVQSNVYDTILVREVAEIDNLTFAGDSRSVATEGKIRFANVSTVAEFLSVYLTEPGSSELDTDDLIVRDIPFPAATDYLRVVPGEYSLIVTERTSNDDETIIIGPLPYEFIGGQVQTALIILPESGGDEEELLIYDDLLP